MNSKIIDELKAFRQAKKFTPAEWDDRGLIESDDEVVSLMRKCLHKFVDEVIEIASKENPPGKRAKLIKAAMLRVPKSSLDTEEQEFMGDYFAEVYDLTGMESKQDIARWRYGMVMAAVIQVLRKN